MKDMMNTDGATIGPSARSLKYEIGNVQGQIAAARNAWAALPPMLKDATEEATRKLIFELNGRLTELCEVQHRIEKEQEAAAAVAAAAALERERAEQDAKKDWRMIKSMEGGRPVQMAMGGLESLYVQVPHAPAKVRAELAERCWEIWLAHYPGTKGDHAWHLQRRERHITYGEIADMAWREGFAAALRQRGILVANPQESAR